MGTCEESVEYSVPTKNIFELLDGDDEENILQLKAPPTKKQEKQKKETKVHNRAPVSVQAKRGQQRISPNASRVSPPVKKGINEDQVVPRNDGLKDMKNESQGGGGYTNDRYPRGNYRVFTNQNRGGGVGGRYNNYRGGGRGFNNRRGYSGPPPRMQNNGGQFNGGGGFNGGWNDNDEKVEVGLNTNTVDESIDANDGTNNENVDKDNCHEEKKNENDTTENEAKPVEAKPETITYEEYKAKIEAEKAKRVEKEFNVRKAGEGVAKSNEKLTLYRKLGKDEEEEDEIIIIRKEPRTKPVDASLIKFQSTSRGNRGGFINNNKNYQGGNQNNNGNRNGRHPFNNNYQKNHMTKRDNQREFDANVDMNANFPELH